MGVLSPRAMILAAGFGTRLGGLTDLVPKPMLPVCGTPLVRWAVLWLRHHGIREIAVNLHHLGEQIEAELGDGTGLDVRIAYSREEGMILGTGGGLRQARPLIDDGNETPIVIVNAKLLLDLDLGDVLEHHRGAGAEATMVLRADPDAERWGSLRLDADGRIVRLLGASPAQPSAPPSSPPLMFTGVHVIQPRFLDRVPPEGEQCVIHTAYRSLFDEAGGLHGYVTRRYWWEHSTLERYLQGVANVLDGAVDLPYAEHRLRGVDPSAHVDPTATIIDPVWIGPGARVGANARVGPHVQIGAGAAVEPGANLRRTVVWDERRVHGNQTDDVVV